MASLVNESVLQSIPYIIACQKNSMLQQLSSKVVACEEIAAWSPPQEEKVASKKKKSKKKKKSTTAAAAGTGKFGLLLSDTVLFPTGGGQPNDVGTISYTDQDGSTMTQQVLDVVRLKSDQRLVIHYVEKPVAPDTSVTIDVDWTRRFDHMQQHSAQHLITAVALETTGWKTTSWNLAARAGSSPCYLDLGTPLSSVTLQVLKTLETTVNERVRSSLSMTPTVYSPEEFAALDGVRSGSKGIKSGKGPVRTVTIEGIESNTCCGTHVLHTGHLQTIKLLGVEKGPDKTTARVWFVAGDRVCDHLGSLYDTSISLTKLLTAGPKEHYIKTSAIVQSNKDTLRQTKNLLRTMATLMSNVALYPTFVADHTIAQHVADGSADFMKQFLRISNENVIAVFQETKTEDTRKATVLVSTGGENGSAAACMMTGEPSVIDELGPALSTLLDGARGGGKNGKYQMKIKAGILNESIIQEMQTVAKAITKRVLAL
jgi:misacylated tRNA(Ala) deacylase